MDILLQVGAYAFWHEFPALTVVDYNMFYSITGEMFRLLKKEVFIICFIELLTYCPFHKFTFDLIYCSLSFEFLDNFQIKVYCGRQKYENNCITKA